MLSYEANSIVGLFGAGHVGGESGAAASVCPSVLPVGHAWLPSVMHVGRTCFTSKEAQQLDFELGMLGRACGEARTRRRDASQGVDSDVNTSAADNAEAGSCSAMQLELSLSGLTLGVERLARILAPSLRGYEAHGGLRRLLLHNCGLGDQGVYLLAGT